MSTSLNHAMGTAKDAIGSATAGAGHMAASAKSTFLDSAKVATLLLSTLRGFNRDDALGLIGLSRKRSVLGTVAILGAGAVVGAGVGILLAPQSGRSLRRAIMRSFDGLKREASEKMEAAGDEVREIERKVEKKASDVASAVKSTVDAAEGHAKEALGDARSDTATKSAGSLGTNNGEGFRASKPQSGPEGGRHFS